MSDAQIALAAAESSAASASSASTSAAGLAEAVADAVAAKNLAQTARTEAEDFATGFTAGTATALAPGSALTLDITGPPGAKVLDLGIPEPLVDDASLTAVDADAASAFRVQSDARLAATFVGKTAHSFTGAERLQIKQNAGVTSIGLNVEDLAGVVGDGSADDTAALLAAMTAAPANSRLVAHGGHAIKISDSITLPKPLVLDGLNIVQAAAGKKALVLTSAASGSTLLRPRITGYQFATFATGERGISVEGTSTNPVTDLWFDNPAVSRFGQYGIFVNYGKNATLLNLDLRDIVYAGLVFSSTLLAVARGGRIKNITGVGVANGYGATATQEVPGTDPPSEDITFDGVLVDGSPWNGFDTHGGKRIKFHGVRTRNCKGGIWAVGDSVLANSPDWLEIIGCDVDSGVDDGSADSGILVKGAASGVGAGVGLTGSLARGAKISGNTVRRHGLDASGGVSAGYSFYYTDGLSVVGNVADECANAAFMLYHDNYGFEVAGNTSRDTWLNAVDLASGVRVSSDYNTGLIGPNVSRRGSKASTYPMRYGTFIYGGAANDIRYQPGYTDPAIPTSINDNTSRAYLNYGAQLRTTGRVLAARASTVNTTLTVLDDTVFMNGSGKTATLPLASALVAGARFTIKNLHSTALTVATSGSDTIETLAGTGTAASVSVAQGQSITVQLDPSNVWRLV